MLHCGISVVHKGVQLGGEPLQSEVVVVEGGV